MALKAVSITLAACVLALMAGMAMAEDEPGNLNALLKGTYQLSSNVSCATSDLGFSPAPDLVSLGSGLTQAVSFTGVITYDGNGNARSTDHGIVIPDGPVAPNYRPILFKEDCSWTYKVRRDGSVSRQGSCKATDDSYTLSDIKYVGQISLDDSELITNQVEPVEQTLSGNGFSIKRICGGVGTEVRRLRR